MINISFKVLLTFFVALFSWKVFSQCNGNNTFLGTTNNDWNTASNWAQGCVPTSPITGFINIASNCTVNSSIPYIWEYSSVLQIESGKSLTNNYSGAWIINGTVRGEGSYNGDLSLPGGLIPGFISPPPLASITQLNCNSATLSGILYQAQTANNVTLSIPYNGGNGSTYPTQIFNSIGNYNSSSGLTAVLQGGTLANGSGSFNLNISGIPNAGGYTQFQINVAGQSCNVNVPISFTTCGTLTYGGQNYATVLMPDGNCWMAENLNIGSMIASNTNSTNNGSIEKYCYANNSANCNIYGGLYQWDEMMGYTTMEGSQGICPSGWHIPSSAEWTNLVNSFSPTGDKGSRMAKNEPLWTNGPLDMSSNFATSGFGAIPGGRKLNGSTFASNSIFGIFWTSTQNGSNAWDRGIDFSSTEVQSYSGFSKLQGFSVRCLQD